MALIKCSECGKEISDKAKSCPNCGFIPNNSEIKNKPSPISIFWGIILIIIGIVIMSDAIGSMFFKSDNKNIVVNKGYIENKIGTITYSVPESWILTDTTEEHVYYPLDNVCIIISSKYYEGAENFTEKENNLLYETIPAGLLEDASTEKKEDNKVLNNITWRTYSFSEKQEILVYSYIDNSTGYMTTVILSEQNEISSKANEIFSELMNSITFNKSETVDMIKDEKEITLGESNALSKALSYLNISAFSKDGLIKQLKFEGFTDEEAQYAVNNCGADWKEQAALKAKSYLDISSFSKSGLIKQLKFEGFTDEEAEYGATAVGY